MLSRAEQPANAPSHIDSKVLGISMLFRLEQQRNIESPILVIPVDKVTLTSEAQF